jgi:hypothetical protein
VSPRTAGELRDALEAVREAIGIPQAATMGGEAKRAEVLQMRVMHAVVMLDAILDERRTDPEWSVAWCRERLAEHPATGYRTWDDVKAEQAAKAAGNAA